MTLWEPGRIGTPRVPREFTDAVRERSGGANPGNEREPAQGCASVAGAYRASSDRTPSGLAPLSDGFPAGTVSRMAEGTVIEINIAPEEAAPTHPVDRITVEVGHGVVGDRHYAPDGLAEPGHALTLIAEEAIADGQRRRSRPPDDRRALAPPGARRAASS